MSSVVSFEKCPICGEEESLYVDFNVRTQEELRICNMCGYKHEYYYPRDEEGNVIQPMKLHESEELFSGVINVKRQGSELIAVINVPHGSSEADVRDMIEEIKKKGPIEEIQATWFDEKRKKIVYIE